MKRILAAATLLVLAGCSAAPASEASSTPTTEAADPTVAQSVEPTAMGWIAGNRVSPTLAEYDPVAGTIVITADVENTSNTDSFEPDVTESIFLDTGSGAPVGPATSSSISVAGATTEIELSFPASADGLVLAEAVLQLGDSGERTWLVPLTGDDAEGLEPATIDATGVADAGGMSFTLDHVEVLPWACDDSDDLGPGESGRVWYVPGADDELTIVLWGDIHEAVSIVGGDTTTTSISLSLPDGTAAPQIGTVNSVFDINEGIDDFALCFSVPAPVSGDYTLNWSSYRGASATLTVTIEDEIG